MKNCIREIRRQRGITMKQLGKMVGVAESTISQYETGKRQPDNETLLRIGEALNTSVDSLLGAAKASSIEVRDENNGVIVLDDDTLEYIDSLRTRPEMKMLFSVSKKATKEDIIKAVKIIEALRDESE